MKQCKNYLRIERSLTPCSHFKFFVILSKALHCVLNADSGGHFCYYARKGVAFSNDAMTSLFQHLNCHHTISSETIFNSLVETKDTQAIGESFSSRHLTPYSSWEVRTSGQETLFINSSYHCQTLVEPLFAATNTLFAPSLIPFAFAVKLQV